MNLKVKKSSILLFVLIFLVDHCFWLVNANQQSRINEICWGVILVAFFLIVLRSEYNNILNKNEYQFGYLALFTVIMGLYSTFQSMRLHGQSLKQGISPQRFMIVGFLLYFVLMCRINTKEGYLESLEKVFRAIGYAELVLYIAQYLLINNITFLNMTTTYRLGGIRMNLGAIGIPYVIFCSVNNIYKNKKFNVQDIICLAGGLYYSFVIAKTRIVLIAYIIAFIGGYLVWKKGGIKKIVVFFLLVALVLFLRQTSLFSYLIDGLNELDMSSQTRELGRTYYLTRIAQHPIFGCGYINTNNANAVAYSGMYSISTGEIAWVDLGVYGLTFFFGIIGLIWFIFLYGKMTIRSYKIAKSGNLTFWMYMIYSIVICPNGTSFLWYISNTIAFVVWMCLIEGNYKQLCIEQEEY